MVNKLKGSKLSGVRLATKIVLVDIPNSANM